MQINVDMGTAPIAVIAGPRGFNLLVNVVVLAASARLNGRRPASDAVHGDAVAKEEGAQAQAHDCHAHLAAGAAIADDDDDEDEDDDEEEDCIGLALRPWAHLALGPGVLGGGGGAFAFGYGASSSLESLIVITSTSSWALLSMSSQWSSPVTSAKKLRYC